ncbi:hypothetical protein Tco_1549089 [Tanacetum coccineum]
MSRLHYNWIMSKGLKSREKPSNPSKTCNFIRRVKDIKVLRNFTYECDFMVLEDVSSVIDHYLDSMNLGKPLVKQSKLTYDKEEGTVMFEENDESVTFKMPHKMERFKAIEDLNTDNIPPFFVASKRRGKRRMLSRKAHLLEDKQIPIVEVFDEVIWETLEGNTRDLSSIGEETRQRHNSTRLLWTLGFKVRGDGFAIPSDAVKA